MKGSNTSHSAYAHSSAEWCAWSNTESQRARAARRVLRTEQFKAQRK